MTAMLASVRSLDEALLALDGGADLIDLKEPSRGALGALDHAAVRVCVRAIAGRRPCSATVGDQPEMDPATLVEAVEAMGGTGVDFIKIGFFRRPGAGACVQALASAARRLRLVAVLFAEDPLDANLVHALASSSFHGAMIDTARKDGRTLRDWKSPAELEAFVALARGLGLFTGLAGSLQVRDIEPLLALRPDYLGFRGALCRADVRVNALDAKRFAQVRAAIGALPRSAPRDNLAA